MTRRAVTCRARGRSISLAPLMLTKSFSTLSLALIGLMSIHHAFACDCPRPPKTSDEILKGITVLFEGEIMDVAIKSDKSDNELRRDDERVTTFRVLRTMRGIN